MNALRGIYRSILCLFIIVVGGTAIILSSYIPMQVGQYHVAYWVQIRVVDMLVYATNIKVIVPESERLNRFAGFLMPNHVSYIDILVLWEAVPTRFLAKNKVRYWPFIGQVAKVIGCVFVKRKDKNSRRQAREMMKNVPLFPPIILFPEGRRGPGDQLLPFRYGGFEIASEASIPILPLAIVYSNLNLVRTLQEPIWRAFWRLLSSKEQLVATIYLLEDIRPSPITDPIQLSIDTHTQLNHLLALHQFQKELMPQ